MLLQWRSHKGFHKLQKKEKKIIIALKLFFFAVYSIVGEMPGESFKKHINLDTNTLVTMCPHYSGPRRKFFNTTLSADFLRFFIQLFVTHYLAVRADALHCSPSQTIAAKS